MACPIGGLQSFMKVMLLHMLGVVSRLLLLFQYLNATGLRPLCNNFPAKSLPLLEKGS